MAHARARECCGAFPDSQTSPLSPLTAPTPDAPQERRELREQQQRTLLDAIPKDLSRPWEDPLPEAGERHLAAELRGIGLASYEVPEWKTKALGKAPTFGMRDTRSIKEQRESLPIFKLREELIRAVDENQAR